MRLVWESQGHASAFRWLSEGVKSPNQSGAITRAFLHYIFLLFLVLIRALVQMDE